MKVPRVPLVAGLSSYNGFLPAGRRHVAQGLCVLAAAGHSRRGVGGYRGWLCQKGGDVVSERSVVVYSYRFS